MKYLNKTADDLGIVLFDKAVELSKEHKYMAWYGYNDAGEIVDYKDEEFKYPAPSRMYPNI